jgi:hypothetical protein
LDVKLHLHQYFSNKGNVGPIQKGKAHLVLQLRHYFRPDRCLNSLSTALEANMLTITPLMQNNNEEETGGQTYTSRPGSDDYFHFQDGDDIR